MPQRDGMKGNEMELTAGIKVTGAMAAGFDGILTPEALHFVAGLERRFGAERKRLIAARGEFQHRLDSGEKPHFLAKTADIRAGDWKIAAVPKDLHNRRVEITGPVERKMVINALNSGARIFMADFEDSAAPTWDLMINGQINLRDAVRGEIAFTDPNSGKDYVLGDAPATLIVRPRGWHLEEAHITVDGAPASAALIDFGLFFFHNAEQQVARGTGPYFYLPKLENHLEARLWNDVFMHAQHVLGVASGSIKATVLIETITAAFEMDEILHELREHIVGLNCGRWDYIFSVIKKFRNRADMVLPDRGDVGMTQPLMRAYSRLLIQTCHRRGAHAMGGMAAQIPIKGDTEANDAATAKVRGDKEREASDGHDGTWVAHPGQVPVAMDVFDRLMPEANQVGRTLDNLVVTESDLLQLPEGKITEAGLRGNINVGIQYIESWLRGQGCVPLYNLMEDAATAEISRAQVWQWLKHSAQLDDGRVIDRTLFDQLLAEEIEGIEKELGDARFTGGRFGDAIQLFADLSTADDFEEFLTLSAYGLLIDDAARPS